MLGKRAPLGRFVSGDQTAAMYAPDGKTLVSIRTAEGEMELEHHIQFWDLATGKVRHTARILRETGLQSGVFSPDSKRFAFALLSEVVVLDVASGEQLQRWKSEDLVFTATTWPALAFAADSNRLYATAGEGAILELDLRTGKQLRRLADRGRRHTVWSVFPRMDGPPSCLAMAPDGKTLALCDHGQTLRFIDLPTGKEQPTVAGPADALLQVIYAADSQTLLTRGADLSLWRWDLGAGKLLGRVAVPAVAFRLTVSADGGCLALETGGGNIVVHDTATGKPLFTVAGKHSFPTCFFAADGKTLLVRYVNETFARLHDVPTGKERRRLPVADKRNPIPLPSTRKTCSSSCRRTGSASQSRRLRSC